MSNRQHLLDRFIHGKTALFVAFVWGLAEATLFFIVPDVLLTMIGCRSLRAGLKAGCAAILGALLGGYIMYAAGGNAPEPARARLIHVPGIHPQLVELVQTQLSERGFIAVLFGPARGIPYKIYAVEWGARNGNLPGFLLISIPGRGIRFLLSALLAAAVARLITPCTQHRASVEITVWALFWIGFYTFYFHRLGW